MAENSQNGTASNGGEAAGFGAAEAAQAGPQLVVQRIYLKDCSFESPSAPQVFSGEWNPTMDLNIGANSRSVGDNLFEVVLTITVEAKKDERVAFLCEVQHAGLFLVQGLGEDDTRRVLNSTCPNIIFPYVREAVSDLVMKGGFPQLLLQPVNFEQLYRQHALNAAAQQAAGPSGASGA